MRVRAIDVDHDWLFGRGANDYSRGLPAVAQNINTRLNSFLGDCFFDNGAGIDWFNFLSSKDQLALNLAVSAVILNTEGVTGIVQLSISRDVSRRVTIVYTAQIEQFTVSSGTLISLTPETPSGGEVKSKIFTVVFASESSKDINVGLFSMHSRRCSVTVTDSSGTYSNEDFVIDRSDDSVITLVAGGAISGTFTVLVFEAGV